MLLAKYLEVALKGIRRPSTALDSAQRGMRVSMVECLFDAKAYHLDDETVVLCDSLIRDVKAEARLIDGTRLPFDRVWLEFSRRPLIDAGKVKGLPFEANSDKEAQQRLDDVVGIDPEKPIGYIFDSASDSNVYVYAVKKRGKLIIDPITAIIIPRDSDGYMKFSERQWALLEWLSAVPNSRQNDHEATTEDAQTVESTMHIAFAFFALMASTDAAMISEPHTSSKLRNLKTLAVKLGFRKPLPDYTVMRLSDLGKLHNQAVTDEGEQSARTDQERRSSPRRHFVRGHLFRRNGGTFWKSPHLRGGGNISSPMVHVINDLPDGGETISQVFGKLSDTD